MVKSPLRTGDDGEVCYPIFRLPNLPHARGTRPIRERTRAGLAAARARGRHGGRPRKMTPAALRMVMAAMAERTTNATEVAHHLGLNRTTLYLYVNGDGTPKARGQALLTGQDHRG